MPYPDVSVQGTTLYGPVGTVTALMGSLSSVRHVMVLKCATILELLLTDWAREPLECGLRSVARRAGGIALLSIQGKVVLVLPSSLITGDSRGRCKRQEVRGEVLRLVTVWWGEGEIFSRRCVRREETRCEALLLSCAGTNLGNITTQFRTTLQN